MRETLKKTNLKSKEGITLIALVITIIVLLILAGVAISMLSGENGILTRAVEAKENTEKASFMEQVKVAVMGAMTNEDAEIKEDELKADLERLGIEKENIISYGNGEYLVINGTEKVIINSNGNVEDGEKITDTDIELQKYFNDNNLPYKCRYGYITGFDAEGGASEETVAEFENKLPKGYEIKYMYEGYTKKDEPIANKEDTYISTGMSVQKNEITIARIILFGDVVGNRLYRFGIS